jgi:putative ABC transport system permease protein
MPQAIEISWLDLGLSVLMMVGVIGLNAWMKLMLGKDLTIGTVRVFVQLYLVGFVLKWIFAVDNPWIVLLALVFMSIMAGYNAVKRTGDFAAAKAVTATGVIVLSTLLSAGVLCWIVIGVVPFYNPQYVIPIAGMAMNGAMNGVALGVANIKSSVKDNAMRIECVLSMGGTGTQAIEPIFVDSVRRALIPTINSLMTAGIVQLPGMMTGQIIAGLPPTSAVRYQILVFYMLVVTTFVSVLLSCRIESKQYFTKAHQLRRLWENGKK